MSVHPANDTFWIDRSEQKQKTASLNHRTRHSISDLFRKTISALRTRRKQKMDRDSFDTLLSLDDRSLADIGVTRDEVKWASSLPLSTNAALEIAALKSSKKQ
ncbi:MAG: DUF1127 domain-containing protein [Pseudomonadota bacterium]